MLLQNMSSSKMASASSTHREYHKIRNRFRNLLGSLRMNDTIDEPTAFVFKNRMTNIINSCIQKNCDKSNGILMSKMLKVEADLSIAGHIIYLNRIEPTDC